MELAPCFGWIDGLVMSLFVRNSAAYMTYLRINSLLWHKCLIGVGKRAERLGGGAGGYGRGRRSC